MRKHGNGNGQGRTKAGPPALDDRLHQVPARAPDRRRGPASGGDVLKGFVLIRLDALEKPRLEEELVEPGGSSPCSCNSVCPCVPDQSCACNEVCTCDTVNSCSSYCSCIGNCCVSVYYMPCV